MAFCSTCATNVDDGSSNCPVCGQPVGTAAAQPAAPEQPQQYQQPQQEYQQQPPPPPPQQQQYQQPPQPPQQQFQQPPQQQQQFQQPPQQPQQQYQQPQPQYNQQQQQYNQQQQQYNQQQQQYNQQQQQYQLQMYQADPARDVFDNKMMAILSYLLFFVPLIAGTHKISPFVKFHVNQGTILFILNVACSLVYIILTSIIAAAIRSPFSYGNTGIIYLVFGLIWLVPLALCVFGIINAVNGKAVQLPVIGKFTIIK